MNMFEEFHAAGDLDEFQPREHDLADGEYQEDDFEMNFNVANPPEAQLEPCDVELSKEHDIASIVSKTVGSRKKKADKRKLEESLDDKEGEDEITEKRDEDTFQASGGLIGGAQPYGYMPARKRQKSAKWSTEEISRFYRSLSMFGTNFTLIANMLPGKELKDIKMKFRTEEQSNPSKVQHALTNRKPLDVDKYNRFKKQSERHRKIEEHKKNQSGQEDPLAEWDDDNTSFAASVTTNAQKMPPPPLPNMAGLASVCSETITTQPHEEEDFDFANGFAEPSTSAAFDMGLDGGDGWD
eukprot:TRINITY_DN3843_c0_g3_i3.p1 TRINITY_DN3843_c0_g3~~TRINITY_DN3843_c0_g3_i3.p1  ORF type:complete len:297 (+),score=76.03 TRINITY_DN3843_c0_g3_i3:33-923(+)